METRGTLRIRLGSAPGAGRTFAMRRALPVCARQMAAS